MATMTNVQIWCRDSWAPTEKGETYEFKDKALAEAWAKEFNSRNNQLQVPEYYEVAEVIY